MRSTEKKVHHILDVIGGMEPQEKQLILEWSAVNGVPVPRVIAQACREFVATHAEELQAAIQRRQKIVDLVAGR